MDARVVGDYIVFTTDHFSKYFVVDNSANIQISIKNFIKSRSEAYKTTMIFSSLTMYAPTESVVHWYIDGKDKGTGETYTVEKATGDYTVQAKLIDRFGDIIAESEIETVKIKSSFFAKLIAFFKQLFRRLPVIEQ